MHRRNAARIHGNAFASESMLIGAVIAGAFPMNDATRGTMSDYGE
jgi:hypothetical protein